MTADAPLIVYVDDERPNRVVFEQSFKDRFRIRTLGSGAEALELLRHEPIAVLITDQRMPEMTGHELLVRVKQAHPETIRIVITAYGDLDPILRAVNEGLVARYIIKPWDRAELDQILDWAIEAYQLGRDDSALQVRLLATERLATLGSISSALVHDLAQPLASLDHNCDRLGQIAVELERELADDDRTSGELADAREAVVELREVADDAKRSSRLMLEMTDSVRQFGRPSQVGERTRCDPRAVVRQVLALARDLAMQRGVRLAYQGAENLPPSAIAGVELTQILLNLCINGIQAIERRGRSGQVVIAAVAEGAQLELTITDDGVGMGAEALRKAGTPFFTTRPDGTGLGVAQCFRLVGRAGGEILLRSTEGEGTTVTVRLPIAPPSTLPP